MGFRKIINTKKTAKNTKIGLLEKPPVFYHKGVKEDIADASMTFEELRICKAEDFTDLEEGKRVSWSVEYCGIRKEIKDPKGTTIISMKEMIERSREFLEALKKAKDKNPCCYVKPKVEMKTKGNAAYKGKFGTLEEARASDKVICLVPSGDGQIYELRKMEQGEFIAPKNKIADFEIVKTVLGEAKEILAYELTKLVHGEEEAEKAQAQARSLFSAGGAADAPVAKLTDADFTGGMVEGQIDIGSVMVKAGLVKSKSEARTAIQQGGVTVDGEKITDFKTAYTKADLAEGKLFRKGKKTFVKVIAE